MVPKGSKLNKHKPCILLYNPISSHGHLDSWCALFSKILLERGYSVLVLTPESKQLSDKLKDFKFTKKHEFHILKWHEINSFFDCVISNALNIWITTVKRYAFNEPESHFTPDMPISVRWRKQIFQIILPPFCKLLFFFHGTDAISEAEMNLLDPLLMGQRIMVALKKTSIQPDCFFNMYLDMFRVCDKSWSKFEEICSLPWGGIKFAPSSLSKHEGFYGVKNLKSICFLDEKTCAHYSQKFPEKNFFCLPDITNTELPSILPLLAEDICQKAKNRKIVFLGGSIGGQKNISSWLALITNADPTKWFFVQIGEVHQGTFSHEDNAAYSILKETPPDNFLMYEQFLPEERDFNAIIRLSDIIFAVYKNFPHSSNMLTKAAYFKKPIIVSERFLMGERVKQYGIGYAVPEDNPSLILGAMEYLIENPIPPVNFAQYQVDFNEKIMGDILEDILSTCMG